MRRKLLWIDEEPYGRWGCSECKWVFNPSGRPVGKSLDEMMQNYQQQRDNDFAAHLCADHPRVRHTLNSPEEL